jgi:hypothetical protein
MIVFKHFGVPPVKVMEWLGISKATLFRWERERVSAGNQPVRRVRKGMCKERSYSRADLIWICQRVRAGLSPEHVELAVWTRIVEGDLVGLEELRQLPSLSNVMSCRLCKLLYEFYDPKEEDNRLMITTVAQAILHLLEKMKEHEGSDAPAVSV